MRNVRILGGEIMERLTVSFLGYPHGKPGRNIEEANKTTHCCRGEFEATGIVEALYAYEETGLTPEEIKMLRCRENLLKKRIKKLMAEKDNLSQHIKSLQK